MGEGGDYFTIHSKIFVAYEVSLFCFVQRISAKFGTNHQNGSLAQEHSKCVESGNLFNQIRHITIKKVEGGREGQVLFYQHYPLKCH